jgi:hypothetical protein
MWDNPDALNRITRLILAATLLFACGPGAVRPWKPGSRSARSPWRARNTRKPARRCAPWHPG